MRAADIACTVRSMDLAKTDALLSLFTTPREARDGAWQARFYETIMDAGLATTERQVMEGPDGFPYFVLQRPPVGQPFSPVSVADVLEHCTDQGLGIVIEPTEHGPEWVFTYGDLFSRRAYGSFDGDPVDRDAAQERPATEVLAKDTPVMIGAPNDEMLPAWSRRVLASFLKQAANVAEPRVLVLVEPSRSPARNLVFNLHPEDFPSQDAFRRVMNALGWFMPPNRPCIAVSKTSALTDSFVAL